MRKERFRGISGGQERRGRKEKGAWRRGEEWRRRRRKGKVAWRRREERRGGGCWELGVQQKQEVCCLFSIMLELCCCWPYII